MQIDFDALEEIATECVMLRKRMAELTAEYEARAAILTEKAQGKTYTLDDGTRVAVTTMTETRPSGKMVVTVDESKLLALPADEVAALVKAGVITILPGVTRGVKSTVKITFPKD